nr:hypothetical protein [Tanacetum cinerariifolium]
MSKLLYTRFTKLIIDYILSHNKSIPRRSDSKLHSSQDNHHITKLVNTTNGDYKFGMEVPDAMISDAIKKKAGYKFYMAKKVDNEKAKIVDKLKEQHVSLIKSGKGKGFVCYGDQVVNVPNKFKKDVVPRKTRSLTIAEEAVEMFPDKNAHHIPSPSAKKIPYHTTTQQPYSLQAKAKKLMQKAKKNIRKFNLKKVVTQKFKEYDQKLKALTNFNVFEAFEKVIQEKVLTEKLLPTHILNAIANYVKPHLNISVLEVIKTNQINLFTQSSTSINDLLVQYNNDVELEYHVSQLKAAVLLESQWNIDEGDVSKPRSFERHMLKSPKPHPCFYNNDYTYLVDLSIEEKYTTSITEHYVVRYYKK